ncbi:pentatricopeptide repeat-containing protein At5g66520-like [Punica granatum]|uniref:Pentatricopeptide repeat-containing protein At5g66520-like n=1 Tax=Punica granatum TaxID=22663 RepID=A0A218XCJ7_PUNGR|nr:pentatricopeptide repeat-containing protein At5g66520-like [Punica granatum]OWM82440.1 hypothetical protein CDL15_Pgr002014 [Punica granatum]
MQLREGRSLLLLTETCKSLRHAYQIHAQIVVNGLQRHLYSLSKIFSFFALFGCPESLGHARLIFSGTKSPNVFMWNTMIRAHSLSELHHEAVLLYPAMVAKARDLPNNFTFTFLLNSCARLAAPGPGFQIYGHVIKLGFEPDIFIRNALMHFCCSSGLADCARKLFEESSARDLVSYNTMISGMAQMCKPHAALSLFQEMSDSGIWPDEFTFVALCSACSGLNDHGLAKQIHNLVYRYLGFVDCSSGAHLVGSVIDLYTKCGEMDMARKVFSAFQPVKSLPALSSMVSGYARAGKVELARQIFDRVNKRDTILWTAIISGYSQAGRYDEALELYKEMEKSGLKPDQVTLVAVLSACAGLGALTVGERINNQSLRARFFGRDAILVTAVVDMYAKCGKIESALEIFRDVPDSQRTTHLFNAMITGLAQHGLGETAVSVFREMESTKVRPDEVTFTGLLCACSHSGLVEEGRSLFKLMSEFYGINPQMQHYCCMVDLLGRDGKLDDAHDFIRTMPFEANSVIWRSLLGSCKLHGNVEMGKIASAKLLELEPDHGARYVLLSNILATTKQWEEAGRVRKGMEQRGIQKPPGWSYIEISNGTVHQFTASNYRSHPQKEEIASKLRDMNSRLRTAGYAPSTVDVVFDVDEEEKETIVSHHSEKLALAFGLLNSGPGEVLQIMKNLRICGDCHLAFKLLSKAYAREIIVRDTARFHHFRNGLCSCKDFW